MLFSTRMWIKCHYIYMKACLPLGGVIVKFSFQQNLFAFSSNNVCIVRRQSFSLSLLVIFFSFSHFVRFSHLLDRSNDWSIHGLVVFVIGSKSRFFFIFHLIFFIKVITHKKSKTYITTKIPNLYFSAFIRTSICMYVCICS